MKTLLSLAICLIMATVSQPTESFGNPVEEPTSPGSLKGQVTDTTTGQGLEYASVLLFSVKDSTMAGGTITDLKGYFRFEDLSSGEYYLVVKYHGYTTHSGSRVVIGDRRNYKELVSIAMHPDPKLLNAVKVEGTKGALTFHLDKQVINASQIMDGGSGTAVSLLQNSPSVTVNQDNQVTLRGSNNFFLLVDGKTVMIAAGDALQQIPSSQVERIEIITSPSAKYDAEGSAGIIHVILKKDRGINTSGMLNLRVGSYDKYGCDGAFNLNRPKLSLNVAAGAYLNNGYPVSIHDREFDDGELTWKVYGENRIRRIRDGGFFRASVDWKPSSTLRVSPWIDISYFGFERRTLTLYEDLPPGATIPLHSLSNDQFVLNGLPRNFGLLMHKDLDTNGQYLEITLSRSQWNGLNDNMIHRYKSNTEWEEQKLLSSRNYEEDNVQDDIQAKADYVKKWKKVQMETGFQLTYRPTECTYLTQNLAPCSAIWNTDTLYSGRHTFDQTKYAAYGTLSGTLKSISILAGLRTEHYFRTFTLPNTEEANQFEHTYWFPSLHLSYSRSGKSQLQFSFNRRINYPTDWTLTPNPFLFDGYTIQTGNPELRPELINNAEINYLKYTGMHVFSATLYYRLHEDAIVRTVDMTQPPALTLGYDNISHSEYAGIELGANLRLPKNFTFNGSMNFYHEKVSRLINNELQPGHLNAMQARAIVNYVYRKTTRMQASFQYFGPAQEGTSIRYAMYGLNLSVRQEFLKQKLSATLQWADLFHTMVYRFTYEQEGTSSLVTWTPEYPNISLSLSYRINDYKPRQTPQIPVDNGAGLTP